jgi:GNAT superfamily N-acetyltransferase
LILKTDDGECKYVFKIAYLAYMDKEIAGQIILRRNWNKYAYIEDIRVHSNFRRKKIGQKLIKAAIDWAKVGILASISTILAKKRISIFAISTYDTDYILVKNKDINSAIVALVDEGYEIID